MEKMKKLLSLLLALAMVFSLAACGGESSNEGENSGTNDGTTSGTAPEASGDEDIVLSSEEGHYTYRTSTTTPQTWSPTDWEAEQENTVIYYTTTPLYDFVMNETKDGYEVIPEGATALPEDVTAEYAGNETYGVPADATEGYAWRVTLNPDVCWEDGTPINADDYVYSMQQFLNPQMKNYRASGYYDGTFALANAKAYYSNGGNLYTNANESVGYGVAFADIEQELYINTGEACYWWGESMDDAYYDYGSEYFILEDGTDFFDKYEADTDILVTEDVYNDIMYLNTVPGGDVEENWIEWCFTAEPAPETPWEDVGLIKNDDYTLTFVLVNPTTLFYVEYNLWSPFLVYEPLYEEYKKQTGDIVKSSYGTTVDSYMSYGPYKLESFQADKEMKLVKNESWYGWTDGNHEGQYQTTDMEFYYIDEHTTELSLFLQGKLDDVLLQPDDMEKYGTSEYAYYLPLSYTYKFSFNSDYDTLHAEDDEANGINHSILSLDEFRHAISLSLDREAYAAQLSSGSDAGYGLLNYMYVCDPDTGELYRDSDWAKQALCEFYGVDDESEITGYDKEAAAAMFQDAYDKAIEQGILKETDKIELDFHTYDNSTTSVSRCNFLEQAIADATVGTSLEGKITINQVADENYYDNCMSGQCDISYTAWGGADMDPYNIIECYVSPTLTVEYGLADRAATTDLTLTLEGEEITHSLYDWYTEMYSGTYATAETDIRNQILAALEKALLETYTTIPLLYSNSVGLNSQRIIMGSDTFINSLVEFGSVRAMTYTMDDAEWAEYCKENNYQLTY